MFHAELSALPVVSHVSDSYAAGTHYGTEFDTLGFTHALILLNAGEAQAGGTLDVAPQMTATSGSGHAAVNDDDGNAIAFTQVTTANDNSLLVGMLRFDRTQFSRYARLAAVVATAAVEFGITVLLLNPDDAKRVTDSLTLDFQV